MYVLFDFTLIDIEELHLQLLQLQRGLSFKGTKGAFKGTNFASKKSFSLTLGMILMKLQVDEAPSSGYKSTS